MPAVAADEWRSKKLCRVLPTEQDSQHFGQQLGKQLSQRTEAARSWIVLLRGELGSGKTTLARGVLKGLGYGGKVPSPSYSLMEHYALPGVDLWHLDLYRLTGDADLAALGLDEILTGTQVVLLLEWPERAGDVLPAEDLSLHLQYRDAGGRTLHLEPVSDRARSLLC